MNNPNLKEDVETIKLLLEKHNLTVGALDLILNETSINIPLSIFKKKAGPLSVICHYLKDYKNLKLVDIAKLLNRDQRTIWASYNKSSIIKLNINSKIFVDVKIFSNRNNSIMENLTFYLVNVHKLRLIEISKLINRSNKTIWCFYNRAKYV